MLESPNERAARLRRLAEEGILYRRGMYQWNHPHNIDWAADRERRRELDLLRQRIADIEARLDRHRVADEQGEPDEADRQDEQHDEQPHEPLVSQRRGGSRGE